MQFEELILFKICIGIFALSQWSGRERGGIGKGPRVGIRTLDTRSALEWTLDTRSSTLLALTVWRTCNILSLDCFVDGPHWGRANEKRSVSCYIRAVHHGLKFRDHRHWVGLTTALLCFCVAPHWSPSSSSSPLLWGSCLHWASKIPGLSDYGI